MQAHCAVCEECLHLGDEEVALLEEGAHLKLVRLELAPLDAAGEVDAREHQDGVLSGVSLDFPPPRADLWRRGEGSVRAVATGVRRAGRGAYLDNPADD